VLGVGARCGDGNNDSFIPSSRATQPHRSSRKKARAQNEEEEGKKVVAI